MELVVGQGQAPGASAGLKCLAKARAATGHVRWGGRGWGKSVGAGAAAWPGLALKVLALALTTTRAQHNATTAHGRLVGFARSSSAAAAGAAARAATGKGRLTTGGRYESAPASGRAGQRAPGRVRPSVCRVQWGVKVKSAGGEGEGGERGRTEPGRLPISSLSNDDRAWNKGWWTPGRCA